MHSVSGTSSCFQLTDRESISVIFICKHIWFPFKGSRLSESLSRDGKIVLASLVTVILLWLQLILFFTLGFLCGNFRICQKRRKPSQCSSWWDSVWERLQVDSHRSLAYTMMSDEVVLRQEVELKENVAYMVHNQCTVVYYVYNWELSGCTMLLICLYFKLYMLIELS